MTPPISAAGHRTRRAIPISQNHPNRPGTAVRNRSSMPPRCVGPGATRDTRPKVSTDPSSRTASVGRLARGSFHAEEKNRTPRSIVRHRRHDVLGRSSSTSVGRGVARPASLIVPGPGATPRRRDASSSRRSRTGRGRSGPDGRRPRRPRPWSRLPPGVAGSARPCGASAGARGWRTHCSPRTGEFRPRGGPSTEPTTIGSDLRAALETLRPARSEPRVSSRTRGWPVARRHRTRRAVDPAVLPEPPASQASKGALEVLDKRRRSRSSSGDATVAADRGARGPRRPPRWEGGSGLRELHDDLDVVRCSLQRLLGRIRADAAGDQLFQPRRVHLGEHLGGAIVVAPVGVH